VPTLFFFERLSPWRYYYLRPRTWKQEHLPLRALLFVLTVSRATKVLSDISTPNRTTCTTESYTLRTRHLYGVPTPLRCYLRPSIRIKSPASARDALFALAISLALPRH
jgi:hypothetical protein